MIARPWTLGELRYLRLLWRTLAGETPGNHLRAARIGARLGRTTSAIVAKVHYLRLRRATRMGADHERP